MTRRKRSPETTGTDECPALPSHPSKRIKGEVEEDLMPEHCVSGVRVSDAGARSANRGEQQDEEIEIGPVRPTMTDHTIASHEVNTWNGNVVVELDDESEEFSYEDVSGGEDEDEEDKTEVGDEHHAWLKSLRFEIEQDGRRIGYIHAFVIDRDYIRNDFHLLMEEPDEETCQLAFDIFNRYGSLRPELQNHTVRKGTGVWSDEIGHGCMLMVKELSVEEEHRRQGIGRRLYEEIRRQAQLTTFRRPDNVKAPEFVLTRPATLNPSDRFEGKTTQEQDILEAEDITSATAFWHSLRFRRVGNSEWLAWSRDPEHASRSLPAALDARGYDIGPSEPESKMPSRFKNDTNRCCRWLEETHPIRYAILHLHDKECLAWLKEHSANNPMSDLEWRAADRFGRTFLHLVALEEKPKCVSWLMESAIGEELSARRDYKGYSPLEALLAALDENREGLSWGMRAKYVQSDEFRGYSKDAVACILSLRRKPNLSADEQLRVKRGCDCRRCLAGGVSPRMLRKLQWQAPEIYDMVLVESDIEDGPSWGIQDDESYEALTANIREKLQRDVDFREGCEDAFEMVGTILQDGALPGPREVYLALERGPPRPRLKAHLHSGGDLKFNTGYLINRAKLEDMGDGNFFEYSAERLTELNELPQCRNDDEWEFAKWCCFQYMSGEGAG